ncbi:MAG: orotidine-5'-phosphate decarboxylase [bacterium]
MTKLTLALNLADPNRALEWLDTLGAAVDCYKLQMDLFGRGGPALIRRFAERTEVFLDLKFHDIPSVVADAVTAAGELGAKLLTVHATGGGKMMRAAAEAAAGFGADRPRVLGVTVLTSLDATELARAFGCDRPVEERVLALARLAQESGCDGVVCSPQEVRRVKAECGPGFLAVCPGIRPAAGTADDQARVATPAQAARDGADYIVVGRPIYAAPDPARAAAEIRAQLEKENQV